LQLCTRKTWSNALNISENAPCIVYGNWNGEFVY
jgi:hypothetical protein